MKTDPVEMFEVYDEQGNRVGLAPRRECHGNPRLIHRTAHVVVFSADRRRVLLQKRAMTKDVQPGRWDTAVGGHLSPGETWESAARREMAEELGIPETLPLRLLFHSRIRNEIESEDVAVFATDHDGPFNPPDDEIDAVRFWSADELDAAAGTGAFTPNLEHELNLLRQHGLLPE